MESDPVPRDKEAVVTLIESFRPGLLVLANRAYKLEAEDCVQDAIINAIARLDTFRGNTKAELRSWLSTITMRQCQERLRKCHVTRRRAMDAFDRADSTESSPSRQPRRDEEASLVNAALDSLPAITKQAINYRYRDDMSTREIAELLKEPEYTIRRRIDQGIKDLKAKLPSKTRFGIYLRDVK